MAITVTRARVKEKCGISAATYDTLIDNLISDMVPAIEYRIRDEVLADGTSGLVATLALSALEIVCGEFLAFRLFEPGGTEKISLADLQINKNLSDAYGLKHQGWSRLKPFLKEDPSGKTTTTVGGDGGRRGLEDPV